ncbi:Putative SET domain, tetratricopeptide-like helical domain superfamily [Septoria linicola]|uniref:SET domain, tetratricopeptide-like helical domain superfamily n=1 Tax=Septoria linicola TaxID=215465 RepID=A0A9Q9AMN7_9PEZI|nr:Putative SET domain, tetratricopeptide-like helical domain superfamily [Septoria linicola]
MAADGGCVIRVDHPSNIVVLHEYNILVPKNLQSADLDTLDIDAVKSHKSKGNAALASKTDDPIKYDLYRNRAMANLYLGRNEIALNDAKAAVVPAEKLTSELKKLNAKTFNRAGCAAYNLERFSAAAAFLERVLELTPNDNEARRELKRANARLDGSSSGSYDFEAMTRKLHSSATHRLDHASFTSNVETRTMEDKGRGLFALRDMEAGELVMCEKAFCTAGFAEDADATTSMVVKLGRLHNVTCPKGASRFLDLYDGGYKPKPTAELVDGVVAVDTYQVHSALDLNGFSCSSVASSVPETDEGARPTGVWLISSAINHCCIGNVSRTFVGDLLLLRANRHIQAGEEIVMRYQNPKTSIAEFHDTLQKTWGFTCECELCAAELKVPGYQRNIRASAINQVAALMEEHPVLEYSPPSLNVIGHVEQLRDQIQNTYSDILFKTLPKPALHMVHLWLCMAYATQGMSDAVLNTAQRVFRDLGLRLTEQQESIQVDKSKARLDMAAIHAAMYAAQIERMKGRTSVAQQYEDFGKEVYLLLCGSLYGFDESFAS